MDHNNVRARRGFPLTPVSVRALWAARRRSTDALCGQMSAASWHAGDRYAACHRDAQRTRGRDRVTRQPGVPGTVLAWMRKVVVEAVVDDLDVVAE